MKQDWEGAIDTISSAKREGYVENLECFFKNFKDMIDTNPNILKENNEYGDTPANYTAKNGDREIFELIIEKNSNLYDQKNKYGNTAAHLAAMHNRKEILELIIDKNLNVSDQGDDNSFILTMLTASYGHLEILERIIKKNPKVLYQKDKDGRSLAICAASNGQVKILELIIEKAPKALHLKNKYGWNPAMLAAENDHFAALKLMLSKDRSILNQNEIVTNSSQANMSIKMINNEKTRFVIYAYRTANNAERLCETLFGKGEENKQEKDNKIPAVDDIHNNVNKAKGLLSWIRIISA